MMKKVFAKNRDAWRAWLEKNYYVEEEIWLVYYKKETRAKRLEEAIKLLERNEKLGMR